MLKNGSFIFISDDFLTTEITHYNDTNYRLSEFPLLKMEINKHFHLYLTILDDVHPFFGFSAAAKPFFS